MAKIKDFLFLALAVIGGPLLCAGGYMFEKSGHQLFEKVDTQDPASIQGLPLQQIVEWWKSR